VALFPDAVSARAARHLQVLMELVGRGFRAALCYCAQRDDVDRIRAAGEIDPVYARTLAEARAAGVQVLAYGCRVEAGGITVERRIGVGTDVV
jgi:sugar fermentation stimulation protein A